MTRRVTTRAVPGIRISARNEFPPHAEGAYVLYWMIAARRTRRNFGLQRAVEWCRRLGRPLLVLEALRAGYPYASDRIHRFVIDGMRDNAAAVARTRATWFPYLEPEPGAGKGLLVALAKDACLVVTDEFPAFFLPHMVAAAARQLRVRLETVDSNGVVPLRAPGRLFTAAHSFRAWQAKNLAPFLAERPEEEPLAALRDLPRLAGLPAGIARRWPAASPRALAGDLSGFPIDHSVPPVPLRGGAVAAAERLAEFLDGDIGLYDEDRNHPDRNATSGLSPWLHFGHVSSFDILAALEASRKAPRASAFFDQLVTWRELGLNFCFHRSGDYASYSSLPDWARNSLEKHRKDPRPALYTRAQMENAATGDRVWNAAQNELRESGRIHNRLRMLWGKKVLEWTRSPKTAFDWLVEWNDRFAIDGRDPNSYSGIAWCFGRYDRPWPERPVFGNVRAMSSKRAEEKLELERYLDRWAPAAPGRALR